jgi:hypothetical protein
VSRIITRGQESPPLTFGPQRVHYSYSVALPQMHLTFVSVLEGLALSELLLGMPLPQSGDLGGFLLVQHACLPYIVSGLLILLIWKQFAHNSTFSFWPPTTSQLGLTLLIAVAQILAFRVIDNYGAWLLGLGVTGIIGGVIRLNNMRLQAPMDWESEELARLVHKTNERDGLLYLVLGLLVALVGIAFLRFDLFTGQLAAGQASAVKSGTEWIVSSLLLVTLVVVEWLDNKLRQAVIRHAIELSDLEMTRLGGVRYSRDA